MWITGYEDEVQMPKAPAAISVRRRRRGGGREGIAVDVADGMKAALSFGLAAAPAR